MAIYHNRLQQIKKLGPVDYVEFTINDAKCSLRLVDDSDQTVRLLSEWRTKYFDAFYDNFKVTEERTRNWIHKHILELPDRILFMIILDGKKVGHIGTFRYVEKDNAADIDNVVRGIRTSHRGLMEKTELALLKLMFEDLKLSKANVSMFSDNYKEIDLQASRIGCRVIGNQPFKRRFTEDGWKWEKIILKDSEYGERYDLIMEITPERFYFLHNKRLNDIKINSHLINT